MNPYKKAAEKIYTYYASGFINDAQKQVLINEYGLKDYFNSNNGIPIYTYEETPAARSFVAKIRTPHEFARGENSDKSTYKTCIDRFHSYSYTSEGKGCLFRAPDKTINDMKNLDIWYQMCAHVNEVLNIK